MNTTTTRPLPDDFERLIAGDVVKGWRADWDATDELYPDEKVREGFGEAPNALVLIDPDGEYWSVNIEADDADDWVWKHHGRTL